jgi:hypothetical protein
MIFNAVFTLDAVDLAEAEAIVGTWSVTAGAQVVSLAGVPSASTKVPVLVESDGPVSDGVRAPLAGGMIAPNDTRAEHPFDEEE